MSWYLYIVDVFGEFVRGLLVFAFFAREIKLLSRVVVERSHVSVDHRIIAVDSYCFVIMGN